MRKAVAILTYARSSYFELVLPSILTQRVKDRDLSESYDIYVFQDGLLEGETAENRTGHSRISAVLGGLPSKVKIYRQVANLGVALHFDFIEKLLFLERGYEFVVFCEDDLILAPGYMSVVDLMGEKFANDPRVGMVAAHPGDCTVSIEKQRANCRRYAPMGHNWGFGLSRSFWERRQPFVECYLDLIRGRPYRLRDEEAIFRWLEFCGFRGAASSQDYIKSCATSALGACKLSTFANLGLPIGRSGLHCTPSLFGKMGFDRAVVFDGDVEAGELDEQQFKDISLRSGHQVGVTSINPTDARISFDRAAWLRKLKAGELHPHRVIPVLGEPKPPVSSPRIWKASDISDSPHMEPEGLAHFERRLREAKIYLEYGAGGSTVLAAQLGVDVIHTVESDKNFLEALRQRVSQCQVPTRLHTHYVDLGPTKEWGMPIDLGCAARWPRYCVAPWANFIGAGIQPELILIDGRFRVACFLASLLFARLGTVILFDDYFNRPHYHVVEKHVPHNARAGRMAEFIVPAEMNRQHVIVDLLAAVTNPA